LNLLLDTGASLALLLYSDSNSLVNMPERIIPGFLGSGLGGMLTGFVGKTHAVQLDTFLMPGVITHFLKLNTTIARNESLIKNGLIGNQILDKFNLIIDFQNESLYLKPAKTFKDVIEYDKSGMLVINGGTDLNKFFIAHVIEGTPAYDAGLRENDEIVKFNGWAVTFFSLSRMNSILQSKEGRKIKISIRRSGKKMKFSFILKSLI
jgi:membrane-associated protease RseP (regulator of RpoE activity)